VAGILLVVHVPEGSKPIQHDFNVWSIFGKNNFSNIIPSNLWERQIPIYNIAEINTNFTHYTDLLDLGGFVTFAPAIVMFLLALSWGGTAGYPFNSATIVGLFIGSAVMFGIFLSWEHYRGDAAMVPLAIFKNRIVTAGCLVQLFLMGCVLLNLMSKSRCRVNGCP